ncbi:LysR family transcriptional regulator [Actibacterium ureilyticum]|uniref:LysR family transcriptional regulator n=1 Tax=Actibacterium ureilyticum TaxID=1590614 RepID=UPI00159625DE|nr:LysR family transcriptional regulator [Actibacterium ureilyticum]
MDRMNALETFVAAVDTGSLNKAGRAAGVTQSAVSQQIKALESLFDQELLRRSPQGVRTTDSGQIVYQHAQKILNNYKSLLDEIDALSGSLHGTMRISVSNFLGRMIVGPALVDLNHSYPELDLVIKIEDRRVDVVRENYDLAVRTGVLGDTDGISRKIATLDTILFAAPGYLDQQGAPTCPDDLARFKFIHINEHTNVARIPLEKDGTTTEVAIPVGLITDSPELLKQAVLRGAGLTRAPRLMVEDQLQDGTLVQVLPEYRVTSKDIHLVYPRRSAMNTRLRLVAQTLCKALAAYPFVTVLTDFSDPG